MPYYDRKCTVCETVYVDCWEQIDVPTVDCACGAPTTRVVLPKRRVAIKTDDWIGGRTMYNGFPEPRVFYSQSSYERALADNGFQVRGDGEEGPGSWISKDALEKAKELVARCR